MKKKYPSIFNDVIGPVMRGPSSSHCAGSLRIGRMLRNLMDDMIHEVHIEYDPNGSLVTTHESQGTDMGLYSGFLGYDTDDERILNYKEEIKKAGIKIRISHVAYGAQHPNTYRINLKNNKWAHQVTALSLGGGMIEIVEINGSAVSMQGDLWETLVFVSTADEHLVGEFSACVQKHQVWHGEKHAFGTDFLTIYLFLATKTVL
jgi:L-serine dehydratase